MENSRQNEEDNMQETSNWSRCRMNHTLFMIPESENEDQRDAESENALDLVVMDDEDAGLDDEDEKGLHHSVAMEDEEESLDDE
ncbi:hypothetical protein QYF36_006627 [Acer negundo]|nr:hypothetical protein QYF36_006627 [Acer negundo]